MTIHHSDKRCQRSCYPRINPVRQRANCTHLRVGSSRLKHKGNRQIRRLQAEPFACVGTESVEDIGMAIADFAKAGAQHQLQRQKWQKACS